MKKIIIVMGIVIGFLIGLILGSNKAETYIYQDYTILPGDTLWGIIVTNVDKDGKYDINKLIYATKEANENLNIGNLEVGKKIKLAFPIDE